MNRKEKLAIAREEARPLVEKLRASNLAFEAEHPDVKPCTEAEYERCLEQVARVLARHS